LTGFRFRLVEAPAAAFSLVQGRIGAPAETSSTGSNALLRLRIWRAAADISSSSVGSQIVSGDVRAFHVSRNFSPGNVKQIMKADRSPCQF
jgi:hypothetical protein